METEVQDLKHVWEQEFGYFVTIEKLGMALDGLRAEVNAVVAGFVKDHDGTDTLLIVYYARHGKPGELHDVEQKTRDGVVWNSTEDLLEVTRADILEIFDWSVVLQA
ncbi:MAG: hypothetical protein Q9190_002871 [Brigantiaea leucoxantha]